MTEGSEVTGIGNAVTVPYTISGSNKGNATQVSVVVTDGTWTEGSGWSNGAVLKQYDALTPYGGSFATTGTGTFTLDEGITGVWGTDYHVYILAEDVNGEKESDYASSPVEIQKIHYHDFSYSASGAVITATCGNDGCPLTDNKVSLTINAPTRKTNDGPESASAILTGLDDFNIATIKTIAVTDIKYVGRDGTTYDESVNPPTEEGKYTAKITVEEKTASVDYEIAKGNKAGVTIDTDGTHYTLTYTDKIIYDGRKHMAYAGNQAPANNAKKAYDLQISISDQNGVEIDPKIIKVSAKKNKNAGTGQYKVKIKGKQYKALNKLLKSPKYKDAFKFTIEKRPMDSKDLSAELNKKGTKLKKLTIKDSDGNLHKLSKKDYKVVKIDTKAQTVVVSGSNNTTGEATVMLK